MSSAFLAAVLLLENENNGNERIRRRILRDQSNCFSIPDAAFVAYYRLNKDAFKMVLDEIKPYIKESSIPLMLQVGATLRFLAEGGYQRSVGKDSDIAFGRSTVSKVLTKIISILEIKLCSKWVKFLISEEEVRNSKHHFFQKYGIPGVIGCIDCTHVKIQKSCEDESLFLNRKGFFSLNAMIICDYKLYIKAVDSCHPGSCHDVFVWSMSNARNHFYSMYEMGHRGSWLLGDSGYGIQPFLITPYRDPDEGTIQHRFNQKHSSARKIVERTIGVLKSRFPCLQGTLDYNPQKVVKIINVCCALHNVCRYYNVQIDNIENNNLELIESVDAIEIAADNNRLNIVGNRIRDEIANNI